VTKVRSAAQSRPETASLRVFLRLRLNLPCSAFAFPEYVRGLLRLKVPCSSDIISSVFNQKREAHETASRSTLVQARTARFY
jgi:hypothetical protein